MYYHYPHFVDGQKKSENLLLVKVAQVLSGGSRTQTQSPHSQELELYKPVKYQNFYTLKLYGGHISPY